MKSTNKNDGKQPQKTRKVTCGQCGSAALKVRRQKEYFTFGAGNRAKELSAIVCVYTCEKCGYGFVGPEAETAYHEAVCKYLRVMPPRHVKQLRKGHGFSRAEFSRLTRLGAATLGRWERGALIQNAAYDQYLYLLRWKENVDRLRDRKWEADDPVSEQRATAELAARFPRLSDSETVNCHANEFQLVS